MDIIVIIASSGSLIDTAYKQEERGASRIYLMSTFALITKGIDEFDKAYNEGIFNKLYATNLVYVRD